MTTTFTGFPVAAFDFYADLELDNTRAFWADHRDVYEEQVREPMAALLEALSPEFGPGRLFRPHRDVRFSADKSPYKDHQGAYVQIGPSCGYYVQVSSGGLMVAGGWYAATPEQVAAYREVVSGPTGQELATIVADLRATGYQIGGDRLKSRPRGVPLDHPRLDLLRHRTVTAEVQVDHTTPWIQGAGAVERIAGMWREMRPLIDWLADNVTGRSG